jgi:sugar lactone lactonase YvrE
MRQAEAQVLFRPDESLAFLPEGPYPCGAGKFSWVGIQHGAEALHGSLNIFDLRDGTNTTHRLDGRPGFAFPTDHSNIFVIGVERSLGFLDTSSGDWKELATGIDADVEGTIINDGLVFDEGLIFGGKDLVFKEGKAGLYLWRAKDQQLIQLRSDQICSNGKAVLERDGQQVLLDIDSYRQTVVQYELNVESGTLGEPEIVVDLRSGSVFPDGMILTPDGKSLIVAIYNPEDAPSGEAHQYRLADGELEAIWTTPGSPQVTCPQLVEWDGGIQLVLMTAAEFMSVEKLARNPNAGCLFIAETPFDRLPAQPVFAVA